jgi:hypothetical protein
MATPTVLSGTSYQPTFEPIESISVNQLPADLEVLSEKHYSDCNVRSYLVKIGMAQEQLRDGRLNDKNQELRKERANLQTITNFLDKVNSDLRTNPNAKEVHLAGNHEPIDKLYEILPDARLKKEKLTRTEAELLCHALTRHSDQQITPNIQELTTDMTHIIEDLDKILPILKELMKSYDDLINRINNKPK